MTRSLINDGPYGQVTLEMIITITVIIMFVSFMLKFVLWEMKEINERVQAYEIARNEEVHGNQMEYLEINLYTGSSLYSYYKESQT